MREYKDPCAERKRKTAKQKLRRGFGQPEGDQNRESPVQENGENRHGLIRKKIRRSGDREKISYYMTLYDTRAPKARDFAKKGARRRTKSALFRVLKIARQVLEK